MRSSHRGDMKVRRSGGWQRVFVESKGHDVSHLFYGPVELQVGREGRTKVAGIGGVGTDPEHRHQGLAGAVFARALKEMEKEKYSATALYTSKRLVAHRLYRRFGLVDVWQRRPAAKLLDPGGLIRRRVSELVRQSPVMGGRRVTLRFDLSAAPPIHVRIEGNEVTVLSRAPRKVDLVLELSAGTLLHLLNGQLALREALSSKRLRWVGDPAVFALLSEAMKARLDPVDEESGGVTEDRDFKLRSFREGDEHALARIFNASTAGFMGPIRVTAKSWREQYRRQSWTGPSLTDDRACCRIAERRKRIIGYAVTDYQPQWLEEAALVQELCVVEGDRAEEVMEALLADAEQRALSRGRSYMLLYLSPEDGRLDPVKARLGYDEAEESGVFMARVLDLRRFLREIEPALNARLGESLKKDWQGALRLTCGEQSAALVCREGKLAVEAEVSRAKITAKVEETVLPLLLLGREAVGELYVQDMIAIKAPDKMEALRLLDALFPRVPVFLPRGQWW